MKKTINLALLTVGSMILFTGCASSQPTNISDIVNNGGIRSYISQKRAGEEHYYRIVAENPYETIIEYRTKDEQANLADARDILEVLSDAKGYCKMIGGKIIYGDQAIKEINAHPTAFSIGYLKTKQEMKKQGFGKYSGFFQCESRNGFEIEYMRDNIEFKQRNMIGGGYLLTYSRFYHIKTYNPKKTGYISYPKNFKNIDPKKVFYYDENSKGKWNYEKGMSANAYCIASGGRLYIANGKTKFKKSSFNDYLFYQLDEIKKHTETHKGAYLYKIFTRDNDVMWCEGPKDIAFTLVHDDETMRYYKGADPKLLKSLGVDISQTFSPSKTKTKTQKKKPDTASITNIQNFISIPANFAEKIANSNIEKALALYTLSSKMDTVKNIGAIQYVTSYNGIEPDGCEYASVTKKSLQRNYIYNYRQCGQAIEYLGKTGVEELTDEAKEQFKQSAKQFENTCKLQNKARMQLNEFVMKCFKNPYSESYKIVILKSGKLIKQMAY